MSIRNEFNTFGHTICRNEAGNPISFDKGFEERDKREKRNSRPIRDLIGETRSKRTNPYYRISRRRGGTIAPNLSNNKMKNGKRRSRIIKRKVLKYMKTAFNKLLIEKYQKINNKQLEMFYKYMQLLLEWNKKINLTAITDENEIILKHFVDSLTVLKYINEKDNIIDVGTGAGFPGIPIAIMMPNVKITLLDSLNKRINFLNEVIKELDLKNVETIHSRSEDCGKDMLYREKYDISIARAVANLSTLSEYLLPFVKIGGKMICMKGSEIEEELKNAQYAIKVLGGKIIARDEFTLPESDIKRNIIIVKKEQYTPKMYPRKAGLPAKEPIAKK